MTVVDAHHHLWDPTAASYPWLTDELAVINRTFTVDDLRPELQAAGVDATVLVQTRSSEDETRQVLEVAAGAPVVAGVVGWVDLTAPDVGERIAALRAGPGGERLVGIRHQVHDEEDPAWIARPDVRRGLEAVAGAGLAYDLLVRTRELPSAVEALAPLDGLPVVLDHLAKPPFASGDLTAWAAALRLLAALPHVSAKVSGLVTEADWDTWSVDELRPAVDLALDVFGPERLMWGSDWPVSLLAAPYGRVKEVAEELVAGLSAGEHAAVFGGNATRTYRLEETA